MPHQPENNNKKEGKKETGRGERGVPEDEEEEEYCVHCTVQQVGRKRRGVGEPSGVGGSEMHHKRYWGGED